MTLVPVGVLKMKEFAKSLLEKKIMIRNALITFYILIVLGFSATARANTIMPIFVDHEQVKTQVYAGEIAVTVDGDTYLVVSETEYYRLESNIDLKEFNGLAVEIEAFELKHKVGPVFEVASVDPLPGFKAENGVTPVLIVFQIQEIAQ
jgi:hypothetical protein